MPQNAEKVNTTQGNNGFEATKNGGLIRTKFKLFNIFEIMQDY